MTIYDFICSTNSNINYKPYEHGSGVVSLSPCKAKEMYEKDLAEMIEFFECYGLDAEKARQGTELIWAKHIVVK